jgi:uncharacterized protein (DUF1330 family)
MMDPSFLTLKTTTDNSTWADAITAARGTILAAGTADAVKPLEPGTAHTGQLAAADEGLVALACNGIAYEGWPGNFVPTIATVDVPDAEAPRTFMVIEGTGTDQERMDRYRDMILPMMRERGAYYIAFELGGDVSVLAGVWSEGIFAISRWPSQALAEDFWYSEKYQKEAIPIRTGVGKFDVQIIEGIAA